MKANAREAILALLTRPRLSSIAELAVLQNSELSAEQAGQLYRLQMEFLRSTLAEGFLAATAVLAGEAPGPEAAPRRGPPRFRALVEQIRDAAFRLTGTADAVGAPHPGDMGVERRLHDAAVELQACYQAIHGAAPGGGRSSPDAAPLTDRESLFLEFMTGLCMAWLAVEIRRLVCADLLRSTAGLAARLDPEAAAYGERLLEGLLSTRPSSHGHRSAAHGCSAEVSGFASVLDVIYLDGLLSISADALDHCYSLRGGIAFLDDVCAALKRRAQLHAAMEIVCSMRHIPGSDLGRSTGRLDAAFVGMAQALHWNGIGSDDGGLWSEGEPLALLTHHSLAFSDDFSTTAAVVRDMLSELRTHAREATARFLASATAGRRGAGGAVFRVFEDASGPDAQVVSEVAQRLNALFEHEGGAIVHASAADASGSNLARLSEHAASGRTPAGGEACRIEAVRYRDLMLPLRDGLVDPDGGGARERPDPHDRHDAYLVGLGLHHVTDRAHGLEFLREAIRFGTSIVRPGGCLAFSEVSNLGPAVEMLVPLDLTDRVGCFPCDLHRVFTFSSLSVPARRAGARGAGRVKIPYEMRAYGRKIPSEEHPVVVFSLFVVLELAEAVVAELDELRATDRMAAGDVLIRRHVDLSAVDAAARALASREARPASVEPD